MTDEVKICENPKCGAEFTRHIGMENRARFALRRTCSRPCSLIVRRKEEEDRRKDENKQTCPVCGAVTRCPDDVPLNVFLKRTSCGKRECISKLISVASNNYHKRVNHVRGGKRDTRTKPSGKRKSNIVDNKPKRPKNPELTCFGDKPTGVIWRPASLGGSIPLESKNVG